jgi:hypothetical protein
MLPGVLVFEIMIENDVKKGTNNSNNGKGMNKEGVSTQFAP